MRAIVLILAGAAVLACRSAPARFGLAEPVLALDDRRPIPLPRTSEGAVGSERFQATLSEGRPPLGDPLRVRLAGDVNARDETVASTFYTPRLAAGSLTPGEVERGPGEGPPRPPLHVVAVLDGGAEFEARDVSGRLYRVRLDPPRARGLRSGAAGAAGRLLWAFGFNAVETHVVDLAPRDLIPGDGPVAAALASVLARSDASPDGLHRGRASRIPDGMPLGPFAPTGVRRDDANDRIPHQDRRALRALRVVAAWLDLSEIQASHTLDVYEGASGGAGIVRHYLATFDGALGASDVETDPYATGDERYLSLGDAAVNLLGLGFVVRPWERRPPRLAPEIGAFTAESFTFAGWRERNEYAPIRASEPEDDYWAAKVLALFDETHLRAAAAAARYASPAAAELVVRTLRARRDRIVEATFARVTPVEPTSVAPGLLRLRDLGPRRARRRFEVRVQDVRGRDLEPARVMETIAAELAIASDRLPGGRRGADYVRVVVRGLDPREGRPAQVHVRRDPSGAPRLVGILH